MKTLRILIPHHTLPDVKSLTTLYVENLIPVIKKRMKVQVIWFVYSPDKLQLQKQENTDITILDIHDFKNAAQLIQTVNPDIIFAGADPGFIDYALSSAGKIFHIPIISWFINNITVDKTQLDLIKSHFTRFFETSVPTDTSKGQKQFMRRGRFFVYKYLFLLKTQIAIKMNMLKIIEDFYILLRLYLSKSILAGFNSKFANTVHFLENEGLVKPLLDAGYERSSLVITGNPIYDDVFEKLKTEKTQLQKNGKIRVLLAPSALYETGYWTREQRDTTIKEIITKISEHKDEFELTIKIHPSTAILEEYRSIVYSVDPSIPIFQKGDILEFLNINDVEISFASSSAEIFALLARKPIIICDFYDLKEDLLLDRSLAYRCKNMSSLIDAIDEVISSNPASDQKRANFIQEFLFKWDGQAAERISEEIINLFERNKTL
ncbi:MAG: CDP-glycerol glycerophosphotransferase family protein [Thaumarchaeota archaeon]|nr:CDP-glycerol glycerophosphotransferase family protein [Nitrososphaerota archaeon]MBI3641328.1 CDP-glycerol glycerophosphotransferase family protein [Nitrososphaerota archaeon]